MSMIPYGRQEITQEDIEAVVAVLKSDFLTQGPKIEEFETRFARYVKAPHAVASSNGTTALHLAVQALNRGPQAGAVLSTPLTFAATTNAALYCGLKVDFVDIDPDTYLMDLDLLEEMLSRNPGKFQGVMPCDFAGLSIDAKRLGAIARKHGLWVVEDACHAPGASGVGACEQVDATVFSFHPVKHIACGEGGMITTRDPQVARKMRVLRTHGIVREEDQLQFKSPGPWYYEMQELGNNYRLTDMQAALGISQLNQADSRLARRRLLAKNYDTALASLPLVLAPTGSPGTHAYHLYVIQTEKRLELYSYLRERNIACQVHYHPVHLQPYYRKLGFKPGYCPNAEAYADRCLSLPMFPSLKDEDQTYVIDQIRAFFNGNTRR